MEKISHVSLWLQLFLAKKYMEEFYRLSIPKKLKLTVYEFLILSALSPFKNLTFYEINQSLPLDGRTIHRKIDKLIEMGLLRRTFLKSGKSHINITVKGKTTLTNIGLCLDKYSREIQLENFQKVLHNFNDGMRGMLDLEINQRILDKKKK